MLVRELLVRENVTERSWEHSANALSSMAVISGAMTTDCECHSSISNDQRLQVLTTAASAFHSLFVATKMVALGYWNREHTCMIEKKNKQTETETFPRFVCS